MIASVTSLTRIFIRPNDGYTGPVEGVYRVKAGDKPWLILMDSMGNIDMPMSEVMHDWCVENVPGWTDYKTGTSPAVWRDDNNLVHVKLMVRRGALVRIALSTAKMARVIGVDITGDPSVCATKNISVSQPYYLQKVPSVNRYWVVPAPRQNTTVPNAMWIPVSELEAA